ncbi:DUF262 domain-containing protein [Streptococcus anginosus]|uniref:DUF262 domain-containing protein n=1 Tax=Streptococcus anginosus TaxID=1328 RepID=UPI0004ED87CB|nr:DUF262 domain-containing protein [Streptococcus anginosus]AIK77237.1 hypothetical protein DK43_02445 [Streptococcus anginosus]
MLGNLETLDVILRENLLRIPDYQRGYSWKNKEIQDFWEDIELIDEHRNHYAGVLTFEQVDSKIYSNWNKEKWLITERRMKPFYIIDGQQRLTTAVILLVTILEVAKEYHTDKKLDTNRTIESIYSDYIAQEKDGNKTYKFLYDNTSDSLAFYIKEILKDDFPVNTDFVVEENQYSNNLKDAKEFFTIQCKKLSFENLDKLLKKLLYNIVFNKYIIDEELDIFVTFETMNNRGKPLSKLELLKNRLIYLTMLLQTNDSAKANLREQINECWKKLYRYLGLEELNYTNDTLLGTSIFRRGLDDSFLVQQIDCYKPLKKYISAKEEEGKIQNSNSKVDFLLDNYFTASNVINKVISINDIRSYIDDLANKITLWVWLNNPFQYSAISFEEAKLLNGIKILLNSRKNNFIFNAIFPVDSLKRIIFSLYGDENCDEKKRIAILQQFESALLIRLFLSNLKYKGNYDKMFSFIELSEFSIQLRDFGENEEYDYLDYLNKLRITVNKLKQAFVTGKFFNNTKVDSFYFYKNNKRVAKYILYNLEAYLIEEARDPEYEKKISELFSHFESDFYNIEHIYPKAGRNTYWDRQFGDFTDKEKNKFKHSLPNLLLIGKKKNGYLADKSYPDKRKKGDCCYEFGILSERKLARDFEDWTVESIYQRSESLKKYINRRWGIAFANNDIFKQFIGLK